MPRPQNVEELRNDLLEAFELIKKDPKRAEQVKEMVNAAGKIIGSIKMELEYAYLRDEVPEIEFMETGARRVQAARKLRRLAA